MILGPSWTTYIGSVALALALGAAGGVAKGYGYGEARVQAKWDEQQAKDRKAIDDANIAAQAAAELYEKAKAAQRVRVVTITKEISHALETQPAWRDEPVPDSVRSAIAAAGAALAASEPNSAVRLPDSGGADQRPIGSGLRAGAREPGGLLGPAP